MFFIMGVTDKCKQLSYSGGGMNICISCGAYCSYEVFVTFFCLSLFFIPIFKWGRKYHVRTSCCGALFSLSYEKGRKIEKGEDVVILDSDLTKEDIGLG